MIGEQGRTIAAIAIETWRVTRSLDRIIDLLPVNAQARVAAQVKYTNTKLINILADAGMSLETFDGRHFDASLPVSALNISDFEQPNGLLVSETIEPTVMRDGQVTALGKVILSEEENVSGN